MGGPQGADVYARRGTVREAPPVGGGDAPN